MKRHVLLFIALALVSTTCSLNASLCHTYVFQVEQTSSQDLCKPHSASCNAKFATSINVKKNPSAFKMARRHVLNILKRIKNKITHNF